MKLYVGTSSRKAKQRHAHRTKPRLMEIQAFQHAVQRSRLSEIVGTLDEPVTWCGKDSDNPGNSA